MPEPEGVTLSLPVIVCERVDDCELVGDWLGVNDWVSLLVELLVCVAVATWEAVPVGLTDADCVPEGVTS